MCDSTCHVYGTHADFRPVEEGICRDIRDREFVPKGKKFLIREFVPLQKCARTTPYFRAPFTVCTQYMSRMRTQLKPYYSVKKFFLSNHRYPIMS